MEKKKKEMKEEDFIKVIKIMDSFIYSNGEYGIEAFMPPN